MMTAMGKSSKATFQQRGQAMRRRLGVPVSLMVIILGVVLSYYVLHANGWNWSGPVALADI
jgi:uncharacterized membrane protein